MTKVKTKTKKERKGENQKGVFWRILSSRRQMFNSIIFARNLFIFAVHYKNSCFTSKCSTYMTNEYFMSNVKIVKIH